MKVLFISNDPSIFDPASAARARMRNYAAAIGTLHIVSRGTGDRDGLQEGGLFLHAVAGGKLSSLSRIIGTARRIIRTEGIEIVSVQDPFEYGWVALRAIRGTTAKLHIQVHTDFCSPWFTKGKVFRSASVPMPMMNRVRRALADRMLPKADAIRAVSERVKASLVERYGDRIPVPSVLPIAIDTNVPAAVPLPPHSFPFTLITVGRLEPEKRIEDILDALARVAPSYPSIGLFIIGEGRSRRRLERRASKLGLGSRVIFLGNRPDAWGLMRSAQGYIQASAYEGYGRTLLEAALARTPIITTDVGIVGEVLAGYEDVLAAPPGDPAALALQITGLLEDNQARTTLAMNAERKARAHLAAYADLPSLIAADLARV
ncbi:MAG TPA: glycosyltransferase [Candidatus Paceibacterota bacterium]|nr:glycosyltransferase [Candidatus Paceibacterota bacterium]